MGKRRGVTFGRHAGLIVAGLTTVILCEAGYSSGVASSEQRLGGPHTGSPRLVASDVSSFPGIVTDLAADERGSSWILDCHGSTTVLYHVTTRHSATAAKLRSGASCARIVRAAPDGKLWIASDYTIWRYTTLTHNLRRWDLSVDIAGALPGALDHNNPLPGTWVSALLPCDAGGVLIARHNVPILTVYDAEFRPRGTVTVPSRLAGASDIGALSDGRLVLTPGLGAPQGLPTTVPTASSVTPRLAAAADWLRSAPLDGTALYVDSRGRSVFMQHGFNLVFHAGDKPTTFPLPTRTGSFDKPITTPSDTPVTLEQEVSPRATAAIVASDHSFWVALQDTKWSYLIHLAVSR